MSQQITLQAASELLWQEADLLDRRAYDEWLDLWTDDGLYIVPIERDVEDYADVLNYAYDDAKMRRMRVIRLKSSHSMSALTASNTIRTVSRFVPLESADNEIRIRAAQHLVDYRRDSLRTTAADIEATIRRTDEGLKLVRKVVHLINCEDAVSGMGYLL